MDEARLKLHAHDQAVTGWATALRRLAVRVRVGEVFGSAIGRELEAIFCAASKGVGVRFNGRMLVDLSSVDGAQHPHALSQQIEAMADDIAATLKG